MGLGFEKTCLNEDARACVRKEGVCLVKKVTENIYIVGGPEFSAAEDCYVYLLISDGELALIDSGCGPSAGIILDNILSLGFDLSDLKKIIVTHAHIDHSGGLAEIAKKVNPEILAHREEIDALEGRNSSMVAAEFYGLPYRPVKVSKVISSPQEKIYVGPQELVLLHTPGHTPGSLVVWGDFTEGRILFGQDLHGPLNPAWGSDRRQWKNSLKKLLDLKADILAEGHFGVISPADKVEKYILQYLYG